jgi:hypothetical protein
MRLLACCLLLAAFSAHAQTEVLPTVTTELKRDQGVMAYASINSFLSKLSRHGEGLFRMDFKVDARKTTLPVSDVRLAVRSDEADYPIKLDSEGRFDLPLLPEAEAKSADLATNVPKGQLTVEGSIELTTVPEQLDMAKVRQIVRVARTLREEMLPWYLRWLFPRIEAVRVCSATPTWELEWRENGQLLGLPLPVAPGERDRNAKKGQKEGQKQGEANRPCTLLTGQESWPDAARLVAPAGSTLSVKLNGA